MAIEGLRLRSFICAATEKRRPHGVFGSLTRAFRFDRRVCAIDSQARPGIGLNEPGSLLRARRYSATRAGRKQSGIHLEPVQGFPSAALMARYFLSWYISRSCNLQQTTWTGSMIYSITSSGGEPLFCLLMSLTRAKLRGRRRHQFARPMERIDRCQRAPIFALSASSDPPFGASYSCAPRALHGLPNASIVRQNRGAPWAKGMPTA